MRALMSRRGKKFLQDRRNNQPEKVYVTEEQKRMFEEVSSLAMIGVTFFQDDKGWYFKRGELYITKE